MNWYGYYKKYSVKSTYKRIRNKARWDAESCLRHF